MCLALFPHSVHVYILIACQFPNYFLGILLLKDDVSYVLLPSDSEYWVVHKAAVWEGR